MTQYSALQSLCRVTGPVALGVSLYSAFNARSAGEISMYGAGVAFFGFFTLLMYSKRFQDFVSGEGKNKNPQNDPPPAPPPPAQG